ncbi:unnamed protein product [Adineta ricciae]|uniref:Uncharacterized protein n=1 Tax=Adineta ricciae TaxID=249248 RepID=A0A815PHK0_ADIRI|nr:unnamed protein product [Adineta ricciae]CAF1596909.1 unnamed protein product [Adineta ricciae]
MSSNSNKQPEIMEIGDTVKSSLQNEQLPNLPTPITSKLHVPSPRTSTPLKPKPNQTSRKRLVRFNLPEANISASPPTISSLSKSIMKMTIVKETDE